MIRLAFTGRNFRYIILFLVIVLFVRFLVLGIKEPPSSRVVYICDTGDESTLTQCNSLDDETSCAGLLDLDGNVAACIESSCGFRLFPHIDVSIAGTPDPYDPDAGTSTTSFLSVMSIIYGLVPYLVAFVYAIEFLLLGNLIPLGRGAAMAVIAIFNDGIFKKLVQQHRPEGSCLYFLSYGMPSGHAATSIGLLTYLLLEVFIYHPNLICGITCQKRSDRGTYTFNHGYGWLKESGGEEDQIFRANSASGGAEGGGEAAGGEAAVEDSVAIDVGGDDAGEGESPAEEALLESPPTTKGKYALKSIFGEKYVNHLYALCYILLLLPVPLSRVYLHDHLRLQVLYGSLVGICVASLWYIFLVRNIGWKIVEWRKSDWGRWWGLTFGWEESIAKFKLPNHNEGTFG